MFASLKVGTRLTVSFAVVVVLMLCIAGIGVFGLASLAQNLRHIVDEQHPKIEHIHALIDESGAISLAVRNALLTENGDEAKAQFDRVEKGRQSMDEMLATLDKSFAAESEESRQVQQTLHAEYGTYTVALIKLRRAFAAGQKEAAREILANSVQPKLQAYLAALRRLSEHEARLMKNAREDAEQSYRNGRNAIFTIAALVALLTGVLAYLLTRSVTQPLRRSAEIADAIARGDLTQSITVSGRDETAWLMQSLETMRTKLAATARQIKIASDTINGAATEIARGNLDLSYRTESNAASLEETASSVEELTGNVKRNAEHAEAANQLSVAASAVAVRGGKVVGEVVQTMSSINDSSKKIADIISVIDGIAFQTNILALNAAVEAARAGDQGRGFAVVAAEVRNLAQRSATAAKEIKGLISDSVSRVTSGSQLVDQAGKTMEEVVTSVKRVTHLIAQISVASREQSNGIEQVNIAITKMDESTQQNAAMVEQSSAAAVQLEEQAGDLARAVAAFKLPDEVKPGVTAQSPVKQAQPTERKAVAALTANARAPMRGQKSLAHDGNEAWKEF